MNDFIKIASDDFVINPFKAIGRDWCLITAGNEAEGSNTLTACWGGLGQLWHVDAAFIFIRPTRYTYEFIEKNQAFSICFFAPEYKKSLAYLGSHSGRDGDKVAHENLHICYLEGIPAFEEAYLALTAKNMYYFDFDGEKIPKAHLERFYTKGDEKDDFHRFYAAEVTGIYQRP